MFRWQPDFPHESYCAAHYQYCTTAAPILNHEKHVERGLVTSPGIILVTM